MGPRASTVGDGAASARWLLPFFVMRESPSLGTDACTSRVRGSRTVFENRAEPLVTNVWLHVLWRPSPEGSAQIQSPVAMRALTRSARARDGAHDGLGSATRTPRREGSASF